MHIATHSITHSFAGQPPLLTNLDAQFEAGLITGLVGPSGSGKSTLLAILSGAVKPDSGRISYSDVESVGWIFQNPLGFPRRTVMDQVVLPMLARGLKRPEAERLALTYLDRFGLGGLSSRQFRHLSGGEAQRVSFARALSARYDAILVDEPTAQLDPTTAGTVREVIRGLATPNRVVIVATHDQALREQCDVVVELGGEGVSHRSVWSSARSKDSQ